MAIEWVMTYLVAYFVTRSAFEIYRGLPRQVSTSESCRNMAKEMNSWSEGELERAGYDEQEISDWNWSLGVIHRMGYGS